MRIEKVHSFDDVLLVPKYSIIHSRKDINLKTSISGVELGIPIISANMSSVTDVEMCLTLGQLGGLGILHRMMDIKTMISSLKEIPEDIKVGFSFGVGEDWYYRLEAGIEYGGNIACLDVAHAHHIKVKEILKKIASSKVFYNFPIIVGNIATESAATDIMCWYTENHILEPEKALQKLTLKVGIGGGSLCTTRIMTGCGIPTLQSILDIAPSVSCDIIADGGIKNSGDIVKCLAAGSNAVMLGSLLSGTKESPGDIILGRDGNKYKVYRGSASFGDKKVRGETTKNIEGVETLVEYKGSVVDIINNLTDGIRSGYSYLGGDLTDCEFVEISGSGFKESTPHGVNYAF